MEKSVLDIICASLDSFFESEKKSGIPAVSGTIRETQIGYTYNMTADFLHYPFTSMLTEKQQQDIIR